MRTSRTRRLGRRVTAPVILLALLGASLSVAAASPALAVPGSVVGADSSYQTANRRSQTRVVIRARSGALAAVRARVRHLNGKITRELPIINGFAATIPVSAVAKLRHDTRVLAITPDAPGRVRSIDPATGYDRADTGSLDQISTLVGARSMWSAGWTGKGVDIALIDTGVAPVDGLTSGNLVNGPDLSTDSVSADLRYLDSYGHGTHMAGLIAGRDAAGPPEEYATDAGYEGIAPDARVISLKVGAADGSADVSQVIAAIGWVTEHAQDHGLNIRVLNLSYGTASTQDYRLDPLAYAVEAAWRKGITVVVAAGNDGTDNVELANPAQDPNIIAVGAEDPNGTLTVLDDTIPSFSNRGTNQRHVDVVAPGTHVLGLRVPGSVVDVENPSARVGTRFFRGSGTSQATAITSGAVALLLQANPALTPDQVKWALAKSATPLLLGTVQNRGAGLVNARSALAVASGPLLPAQNTLVARARYGTGTGSLELARGGTHVVSDTETGSGQELTGEQDIFGAPWVARTWAADALAGTSWTAGSWRGTVWTGGAFDARGDWAGAAWTAPTWTGGNWAGRSWVGRSWVAGAWVGSAWAGSGWLDGSWSGRSWVNASWSSTTWK